MRQDTRQAIGRERPRDARLRMVTATSRVSQLVMTVALLVPSHALGQTAAQNEPAQQEEERSTGLPAQVEWKFNFDATWGTFDFKNSLFRNPKEDVSENLSDQWFEGSIKAGLSGSHKLANASELYGKVSAVGERTYGSSPATVGPDISSFQADDLFIGWRSGESSAPKDNLLDVTVGRAMFKLGNGMLLNDGTAEGGSRGGYWTNARKAFQFAAIGRFNPGHHTVETFYLDKDDLPENDTGTRLWGANYEFNPGEHATLGVSYLKFWARPEIKPERNGLNVFNLRAYLAPLPWTSDFTVDYEYATERNGDVLHSNAWTLQGGYALSHLTWKPTLTYRYTSFEGDDLATTRNENFDPLLPGFHDWGSWWQGEIAGEYFLSNSNLTSHVFRVHFTPSGTLGWGGIFYKFSLDQPASFAPGVTDKNLAVESDGYVDWKLTKNFTATFVGAFANPQAAAQQAFNRTSNFTYAMAFLAYSY